MTPKYICHPDFASSDIRPVFFKENPPTDTAEQDPEYLNRHILFRRKFNVEKRGRAILRITADDYYKLYINGSFVTQGPAPSYPFAYYYNEIDVTEHLTEGENVIAVHTYYQGLVNRVWVSADRREMLWCSLSLDGEDLLVSDEAWLVADHMGYSEMGKVGYDTAFLERYDSRAPECRFYLPDFDDSSWRRASVFTAADYTLIPQPTRQLDIYPVDPVNVEKLSNGLRADMGREYVGYPRITARGNKGDKIIIKCAEELNTDGSVRYDMRCNCRYLEEWILSGDEDVLMQYDYKAWQYIELEYPDTVEILDLGMTVRHYPFEARRRYTDESPELTRIFNLCADTLKYGTQEIYMDCPTREKGQYLGDLSVSGRAHTLLTGDTAMFRKAITNFCESSFICPGIMAVSVSSLMQEIADYSLELPLQICWLYSLDGDIDFLRYTEPYVTGMVEYFKRFENADGLIETLSEKWNMVDWPDNLRDGYDFSLTRPDITPGVHNVICSRYIGFLESVNEMYSILGKPLIDSVEKSKSAFIKAFYSDELGLFCDSSEKTHASVHSNIFPLLFDIGTKDDTALTERIIRHIENKKLTSMGVYMAYYALAALIKAGKRDLALTLATDEGAWLNMLSEGATATYEAWGRDQKWNTSLFHPWATAPLVVFADGVRIL